MNKRQVSFLNLLLNNSSKLLPMGFYAGKLQVSSKTLQRDLEQVEGFLKKFKAEIEKKSGVGIRIIINQDLRAQMNNHIAYLSYAGQSLEKQFMERGSRRMDIVLNLLLYSNEYTSLSSLAYKYYVSKGTINNDLLFIDEMLGRFTLKVGKSVNGTMICGEERNIRQALVYIISQILDINTALMKNGTFFINQRDSDSESNAPGIILDIFREDDICFVNRLVCWIEKKYSYKFDDNEFENVTLSLLVMVYRIKNGYRLGTAADTGRTNLREVKGIKEIVDEVTEQIYGQYRINLALSEREGIRNIFLASYLSRVIDNGICADDVFHFFSEDFIDAFAAITNINLRENPVFCENVISHIILMLNRLYNGTPASNPLMELLIKDYQSTLNVCKIICCILARKFQIPELSIDEISFLMLYILGEIVRQSEHARVLFVTDMAKSVANLMKLRLQQRFPQWNINMCTMEGYRLAKKGNCDFCISTFMLEEDSIPYVYVSPILDDKDFRNIQELFWKTDKKFSVYQLELVRIVYDLRDIGCDVDFLTCYPAMNNAVLITIKALKGIRYRYSINEQEENRCVFVLDDSSKRILEVHIDMCNFDFMLFSSKIVYLLDNCPDAVLPDFIKFFTEGESNV